MGYHSFVYVLTILTEVMELHSYEQRYAWTIQNRAEAVPI